MNKTYKTYIKKFDLVAKKKYKKKIVLYDFIYNNYLVKKLITICTKNGSKHKIENIFFNSFISIKHSTKKDVYLILEKAFSVLNMLLGNTIQYFGTKKVTKGIILNTYQQYILSINQYIKYMKNTKGKSLSYKLYKTLLELYTEKGYLLTEKKKIYISLLKANK
jgi:ribosomal protein S7